MFFCGKKDWKGWSVHTKSLFHSLCTVHLNINIIVSVGRSWNYTKYTRNFALENKYKLQSI